MLELFGDLFRDIRDSYNESGPVIKNILGGIAMLLVLGVVWVICYIIRNPEILSDVEFWEAVLEGVVAGLENASY